MSDSSNSAGTLIATLIILAVGFGGTLVGACDVPAAKTKHVLEGAGYTKIEVGGHAWFACSGDDSLATEFTAVGPSGKHVSGSVCCGWAMKDCTIRSE
jgi:hypothetical protein